MRIQHAVFGYIRKMENILSLFSTVPIIIIHICLVYYYDDEYFIKSDCNNTGIIVSNDRKSFMNSTHKFDWIPTIYGYTQVESTENQIAKWTFKIAGYVAIFFLSKHNHQIPSNCVTTTVRPYYGFSNYWKWRCDELTNTSECFQVNLDLYDSFTVILNTQQKTIGLILSDNNTECIFENIKIGQDIKYKLAITMPRHGSTIKLIDFISCIE